jgi:cytoskeletal protein CcmA (bactofilin family)
MWKKDEVQPQTLSPRPEPPSRPERPPQSGAPSSGDRATIGRSITIKGEVSGDEDLLIQGRIDGSVQLRQHSVTVGPEGEVKASIVGRVVTVEGSVVGDLNAEEQVILRSSARVEGDITAPRVVVEDGARFRGGVDMVDAAEPRGGTPSAGQARRVSEPVKATAKPVEAGVDKGKGTTDTPAEVTT